MRLVLWAPRWSRADRAEEGYVLFCFQRGIQQGSLHCVGERSGAHPLSPLWAETHFQRAHPLDQDRPPSTDVILMDQRKSSETLIRYKPLAGDQALCI